MVTVIGFIRVRLIVQVCVLACFIWEGLISIALTMVPCFSCYQITGCKANNSAIACSNSSFSNHREPFARKSTHWVKGSRVLASFLYAVLFWQKMHIFGYVLLVLGSSHRAGSFLFAFQTKFRNLWSSCRCLRNAFQVSLYYKKAKACSVITDMGDFLFLGAKSSISLWFLIILAFKKDFQQSIFRAN